MSDEIFGRLWTAHHTQFSTDAGRAIDRFFAGLKRLQQRQFEAPWRAARRVNR